MEDVRWTEEQLIDFVKNNEFPTFNARTLKRYRAEKVMEVQVEHPGFGGTSSWYAPEAGQRALVVCQLLRQRRNYDVVRLRLWLSGQTIELGILKESLWRLTPFSSLHMPTTLRARQHVAKKLARAIVNAAWRPIRSNLIRKILQRFETDDDQHWFVHLHTQLRYGLPVDFQRDFLHEPSDQRALEEHADVFASGLQTEQMSVLPKDLAPDLQCLADQELLSLTKHQTVLFASTEEDLALARTRLDILQRTFDLLELLGQLSKTFRLLKKLFSSPAIQSLFIIFLLILEQNGYGPNIDVISEAIRINEPIIMRGLAVREVLQQELPLSPGHIWKGE